MSHPLIIHRSDLGTLRLTTSEGNSIKSLIRSTGYSQAEYAKRVGLQSSNLSLILSGQRPITIALLAQIVALAEATITCEVTITVHPKQTGATATDANSVSLEDLLCLNEEDFPTQSQTATSPTISTQ